MGLYADDVYSGTQNTDWNGQKYRRMTETERNTEYELERHYKVRDGEEHRTRIGTALQGKRRRGTQNTNWNGTTRIREGEEHRTPIGTALQGKRRRGTQNTNWNGTTR